MTFPALPKLAKLPLLDIALAALGVTVGSVSLARPFGPDQGLYYYVGREWLFHDKMPYRDLMEQKTPGVFLLHALGIGVFGEHLWSIRVLELACVVVLGLVSAAIAVPRGATPAPGLRGACVFSACLIYFGLFHFWDSAQCEIWASTAGLFALYAALRERRCSASRPWNGRPSLPDAPEVRAARRPSSSPRRFVRRGES